MLSTDHCRLAPAVILDSTPRQILDRASSSTITLNESGYLLASMLEHTECTIGQLADKLASEYNLASEDARQDAFDWVLDMNGADLVNIRLAWTPGASLKRAWTWIVSLLSLSPHPLLKTRYLGDLRGLSRAMVESFALLTGISVIYSSLVIALIWATIGDITDKTAALVLSPMVLLAALFVSGTVHELAHMIVANSVGSPILYVIRIGTSTRCVVQAGTPKIRLVAAAGPLLGLIVAALLAWWTIGMYLTLGVDIPPLLISLAVPILPHLWAALPFSADGSLIWGGA